MTRGAIRRLAAMGSGPSPGSGTRAGSLGALPRSLAVAALLIGPHSPGPAPAREFPAPAREAPAPSTSAATACVVSLGDPDPVVAMPLAQPFERLLRERGLEPEILSVETVTAYYAEGVYRLALAPLQSGGPEPAASTRAVVMAVGSESGAFAWSRPEPELTRALFELAQDTASYRLPLRPRLARLQAAVERSPAPDGGTLLTVALDPPPASAAQGRQTAALVYRVRLGGGVAEAVFLYRTLGGMGRLATSLAALRAARPDALIVARSALAEMPAGAGRPRERLEALESLGLRASGVGLGELLSLDQIEAYRRERPTGTLFLSANLVVSSAPASHPLAPHAVIESGGLRIGIMGLTRLSHASFLTRGRLRDFTLADPVEAARASIAALRGQTDVIVALSNLSAEDHARLREKVRGLDVILADEEPFLPPSPEPKELSVRAPRRGPYDSVLLTAAEYRAAVTRLDLAVGAPAADGTREMAARQVHLVLDETVPEDPSFKDAGPEAFGVGASTGPVLVPAARRVFPERGARGLTFLTSRQFWTLAASVAAWRAGAEVAILPVHRLAHRPAWDVTEGAVREWLSWDDELVVFELGGSDLKALLEEAAGQESLDDRGSNAPGGRLPLAAAGIGPGGSVHGVAVDPGLVYRVAGTELLLGNAATYPQLARARSVDPRGPLQAHVLEGLRELRLRGWLPGRYRALMEGAPVAPRPLWIMRFREAGLNISSTRVVRPDEFDRVPNSRIQGFDQLLTGGAVKLDAELQAAGRHRWTNTLEAEYSRVRLKPRRGDGVVNTPSNRGLLRTVYTRRVGSFPWRWLACSFGPSLGLQGEGELERPPLRRRKEIYSVHPGIELFDGSLVRTVEISANFKRDLARDIPNTQYGLRGRVLVDAPLGRASVQGEAWANYFLLTRRDLDQDLRLEGDVNVRLNVPLWGRLTLAPFLDLYFFQLKVSPASGYSAVTGISLGFSRIWKPQYESF